MKRFKKLTAGLMGVVMALGVCSFTALADDTTKEIDSMGDLTAAVNAQEDGQIWEITGNFDVTALVGINKNIVINGKGHTLTFTGDIDEEKGGKNSFIQITGKATVEINDLTIDGNKNVKHCINVYGGGEGTKVTLDGVTMKDGNEGYGLVVNSAYVTVKDIETSGNGWGGINVDTAGNEPSKLIVESATINETGEDKSIKIENKKDKEIEATIKDGTFEGEVLIAENVESAKLNITGGKFKDKVYVDGENSKSSISITGGTFANDVTEYMDDDSKLLKDEEGNYVVLGDEAFEKSDKEFYISDEDDLKLAEKYQADGVIWELAEDATYSLKETLQLNKDVVINGNGSTIIFTENIVTPNNDTNCGFNITGGNSEINDLTIKGNGNVKHGINVFTGSGNATKVTIDSVNVYDCKGSGLQNNSSNVKVSNFNTSGNGWSGINVDNKYNIKDANFVMESGNIEEETSVKVEKTPYGNGEQLTTYATIKGGTFGGIVESRGISALTIKGGNFEGEVEADGKENLTITSGEFSNDVSDYLDKGSHLVEDKDGNFVVYEDYLDDKKPSHSYELEEGRVDRNDEEEEPVVTTKPEEEAGPFSDVGKDNPNYDAIIKVYEKGWMAGIGDGVFAPNGTLTRAMGATVLWNKAGKPEPQNVAPFLDVTSDAWYAKAVAWAYEQGIVAGYGETFGPGDALTTEQFTRMNDIANGKTPEAYIGGAPNATRGWVASLLAM